MYMIHRKGADRDEILIHLCVYELKELAKILVKKTRGGGDLCSDDVHIF